METRIFDHPEAAREVRVPSSKSAALRALLAAAFATGTSALTIAGAGADVAAMCGGLRALGAHIDIENDIYRVTGGETPREAEIDCGESGAVLRFLLPVAAARGVRARFGRRGRLAERPIAPLAEELTRHGARVTEEGEFLLLDGAIRAGDYRVAANVSSQFLTGLLFALSLTEGVSTLTPLGETVSTPYLRLTRAVLSDFGADVSFENGIYRVTGQKTPFFAVSRYEVEGDCSAAAFPLAAGALGTHPVTVLNFPARTEQGDRAILSYLAEMDAKPMREGEKITVFPAPLRGISVNLSDTPDLLPVLAVLGACAKGETTLSGIRTLRFKESDRVAAVAALLRSLGADVTEGGDLFTVRGGTLSGGTVAGARDHRVVMAAAIAAIRATGKVTVTDCDAVTKSYPDFFQTVFSAL